MQSDEACSKYGSNHSETNNFWNAQVVGVINGARAQWCYDQFPDQDAWSNIHKISAQPNEIRLRF